MEIKSFDFGKNIVNAIDVSLKQVNYSTKYSKDAKVNQLKLLERFGLEKNFQNRVDLGCANSDKIAIVRDYSFSEDLNPISGFDGVITDVSNLPLFSNSGDCILLLVVGKNAIGILHCSLKTIDSKIIMKFFEKFRVFDDLKNLKIGISPYVFQEDFCYEYLNIARNDLDEFVLKKAGKFFLDLKGMVLNDLKGLGVCENQIMDFGINSYEMSRNSFEEGGVRVSHKEFFDSGRVGVEGRLGLFLMKF